MRRKGSASPHRPRPNIVSLTLTPAEKDRLDAICDQRGMSIKNLLSRLVFWFAERDTTEQAIIMGHVERRDVRDLATMLEKRG